MLTMCLCICIAYPGFQKRIDLNIFKNVLFIIHSYIFWGDGSIGPPITYKCAPVSRTVYNVYLPGIIIMMCELSLYMRVCVFLLYVYV